MCPSDKTSKSSSTHFGNVSANNTGPTLLHFQANTRITPIEVTEYRLDVDGGVPDSIEVEDFTAKSRWALDKYHGTPLAQSGPLTVLAPRSISRSVTVANRTVTPVEMEDRTLTPSTEAGRDDIADLVKSDLRRAIPESKYEFQFISDISNREPAWTSDSGNFAAHHTYDCSIEVTSDGDLLLHVEISHEQRALTTLNNILSLDQDPPRIQVEHDLSKYETEGTATVLGWSDYNYTDKIPEFGDSIASYHEGIINEKLGIQLREENPRLLKVRYGKKDRYQLPHVLSPVTSLNQVKDEDYDFHRRFTAEKALLPGERYTIAKGFVKSLQMLPTVEVEFVPEVTSQGYSMATYRDKQSHRLVFGGENRGSKPRYNILSHGVYQSPGQYRVRIITPSTNSFEEVREGLPGSVARALAEIGAPAGVTGGVQYDPGPTSNYTETANQVNEDTDVAVVVVPNKDEVASIDFVEDPFDEIKRRLMRRGISTQMMQTDTARRLATTNVAPSDSTFSNILSAIVSKAGGTPWKVANFPGKADAFLGLDVTRKGGQHAGAAASVMLPDGTTFAAEFTTFQDGERFRADDVERIVRDLVYDFDGTASHSIDHLTVFRDGKVYEDVEAIRAGLSDVAVTFDLVGVRKSGQPRVGHFDSEGWRIADKGVAFIDSKRDRSILHSWGVPDCDKDNTNGTPRTIGIRKDSGPTSIETLTEQAYWLSEIHYGSPTISTRLPVPISYADKAASYVREGFADPGSIIDGPAYL